METGIYNGVLVEQMMIMEAFLFQRQISNQLHLKVKDVFNRFLPSDTFFITIALVKIRGVLATVY